MRCLPVILPQKAACLAIVLIGAMIPDLLSQNSFGQSSVSQSSFGQSNYFSSARAQNRSPNPTLYSFGQNLGTSLYAPGQNFGSIIYAPIGQSFGAPGATRGANR